MSGAVLPEEFKDMKAIALNWALPTERLRSRRRWHSSAADFQAFYDVVQPNLAAMLTYLDGYPLDGLDASQQRLLHLCLALAEAAPHVELYKGAPQVPNSFDNARVVPDHANDVAGHGPS